MTPFEPLPDPQPNDWLANHPESGQTFEDFISFRPNRPDARRRTIHIQPLAAFGDDGPPLGLLEEFATAFFSLPVNVHPPSSLDTTRITSRRNPIIGQEQLLTADILGLLKWSMPSDAFCVIGITMTDLYRPA